MPAVVLLIEEALALSSFALKAIRALIDDPGVRTAAELADDIHQVFAAVAGATTGKVTPESAKQSIEGVVAKLTDNNARADAARDAKFPPETA